MEVEYPWNKRDEPPDLVRDADIIQLIHIETYHKFMGKADISNMKTLVRKIFLLFFKMQINLMI